MQKLIKARKDKKFSQQDIAEYLNISQTHYLRKEKGDAEIRDDEWQRIANLLDVTVDDIKEEAVNKSFQHNFENVSGSYVGNNNNYFIPDFILENQQDYIKLLKKEIERLHERLKIIEGN